MSKPLAVLCKYLGQHKGWTMKSAARVDKERLRPECEKSGFKQGLAKQYSTLPIKDSKIGEHRLQRPTSANVVRDKCSSPSPDVGI